MDTAQPPLLERFFSPAPSLKICGVTSLNDAQELARLRVHALGINFWPPSKRYCSPDSAMEFARAVKDDILRVGVFVNNAREVAEELVADDLIDVIQLHGDESSSEIDHFLNKGIPVIRAVSASKLPDFPIPTQNFALLIDTPAGKDYGGTGKTFDWSIARDFAEKHPEVPLLLAGGLTPENAADALEQVSPAALDIASGAEISPGIKDFEKVRSLLSSVHI